MTNEIEHTLDILDERYASITHILEIPLFYDSVEIRKVMADITKSRDAILRVATIIGQVKEEKEVTRDN
jgi:hypothetical protein